MPKKWSAQEINHQRKILSKLYVDKNLTIGQIGKILDIKQNSVYDRLVRLGITISRKNKAGFNNQRRDISLPQLSTKFAEFIGILLGDGQITPTQIKVTLGIKEDYGNFVSELIKKVFNIQPKIITRDGKYIEIYFGSTLIVRWLIEMGLAHNKVLAQVCIPQSLLSKTSYHKYLIRGLIDTDGSIYKIKSGIQISFTNKSVPLLKNLQYMLRLQGFSPSKISVNKIYLTKKKDITKYVSKIGFNNPKHLIRYNSFINK